MEEEAREILRSALSSFPPAKGNLAEAIRRRFAAFGGLEPVPRGRSRSVYESTSDLAGSVAGSRKPATNDRRRFARS
jgi:hypothetical protein